MRSVGHIQFPVSTKFTPSLLEKISTTSNILKLAYADFGPEIGLSFNGGKDSTVVLDLVNRFRQSKKIAPPLKPFFIDSIKEFPEVRGFVKEAERFWGINIVTYPGESLKDTFEQIVEEQNLTAFFMGQRQSDPGCESMEPFAITTEGWAKATRINLILPWSYRDVWNYIDCLKLPTCSLYEKGYTSVGLVHNTKPNPHLFDKEKNAYRHARELKDESKERSGRM